MAVNIVCVSDVKPALECKFGKYFWNSGQNQRHENLTVSIRKLKVLIKSTNYQLPSMN